MVDINNVGHCNVLYRLFKYNISNLKNGKIDRMRS